MKKKAKIKKAYFLIILFIMSIYYSYKYFENKNKTLNNKEIVELVVNNSFKEENIIKQLINYNSNPIRLLNKTYEETIEEKTDKPVIYLYNTHPKEEYNKSTIGEYSINPTVIMNNYILEDIFEKKGFPSFVEEKETTEILDKNNWNYASSYKASRILIEEAKDKYNSLKYYIDIHRDSLEKSKTTITIEGKDYAKILFILGLENENYQENLDFIEKINNKIEEYYPNLSKGIYKKSGPGVNGIYNQDFSKYTILIEVGGYENTTTEVLNTAIAFSKCFLEVLNEENN